MWMYGCLFYHLSRLSVLDAFPSLSQCQPSDHSPPLGRRERGKDKKRREQEWREREDRGEKREGGEEKWRMRERDREVADERKRGIERWRMREKRDREMEEERKEG